MPDLSAIDDVEELENRWLNKAIVYVEAEIDERVYTRMAGPNVADRLEFKTPKTGGAGQGAVAKSVARERGEKKNTKVFGLLDGEASVTFGALHELVGCDDVIFDLPGVAEADGLIFLQAHELENILLLYGDLCDHVCRDVRLMDFGTRKPDDVRALLIQFTQRFFSSAMVKYAGLHLRFNGSTLDPIDGGQFLNEKLSTAAIMRRFKQYVVSEGGSWAEFSVIIRSVLTQLKGRFAAEGLSRADQEDHLIRLADGKGLLTRLKAQYKPSTTWDGSLVEAVVRHDYSSRFTKAILLKVEPPLATPAD